MRSVVINRTDARTNMDDIVKLTVQKLTNNNIYQYIAELRKKQEAQREENNK